MMARASASLVVVSPSKKVLMMKRPTKGSFANVTVFPGGALDAEDPSLAYCALRETFEETGLLINPITGQSTIEDRKLDYKKALKSFSNFEAKLHPVSEWTTPAVIQQKRFTTQFYLFQALEEHSPDSFVQDEEVKSISWVTPKECLADFASGKIILYPPQFFLLTYLDKLPVSEVIERLRDKVIKPKPIDKFDGGIVMDWGSEGKAKLTIESKVITKIDWKL